MASIDPTPNLIPRAVLESLATDFPQYVCLSELLPENADIPPMFVPRSARWLVTQKRIDEARSVLHMLGSPDSEAELREIIGSIHREAASKSEPLLQREILPASFSGDHHRCLSQLSGINAVLYYLNDVFAMVGFNAISSGTQAVAIGLTNLIATLIAMALIDRVGRKALLLTGSCGMVFCLCGVAYVFLTHTHLKWLVVLLICDVGFFAMSVGAVQRVYMSEVFPNGVGFGRKLAWKA